MSIQRDGEHYCVTCDTPSCDQTTRYDLGDGSDKAKADELAREAGWEILDGGRYACPSHASWRTNRTSAFNLRRMVRTANYEGAQGYFVLQRRAWQNCVRCKFNSGSSAQKAWQECLDQYQKMGNNMEWAAAYVPEKVFPRTKMAEAATQVQMAPYWERIQGYRKQGMSVGQSVMAALDDCRKDAQSIPER